MSAEWLATLWSCESVPECPNIEPCVSGARGCSPVELVLACLSLCTRVEVRELLNTGGRSHTLLEKRSWEDSDQKDKTRVQRGQFCGLWSLGSLPSPHPSVNPDGKLRPGPDTSYADLVPAWPRM